ncbi:MAG: outer membrane beta-barrel protein [Bacteroidia bacterium]|nr:PorT family protein [Bacteroidia bacterium]MDW8158642.1 outer membrane beta-barrel protein [Bacteroidia bacterium]
MLLVNLFFILRLFFRWALVGIFLFFYFVALAQEGDLDIVYLKNGSILKGEILEVIPNEKVIIRISEEQILELSLSEVERIRKGSAVFEEDFPRYLRRKKSNNKFEGYSFLVPNLSIGSVDIERRGKEGNDPRNGSDLPGYEVGLHFLNMFSRSWGLGLGLRFTNYSLKIPYYLDATQGVVRYFNQDFYYLNIPVFFSLLTGRPQSVNFYLNFGLEPSITLASLQPLANQIEMNRFLFNYLFGVGLRVPFNENLSVALGFRTSNPFVNAGWSSYVDNFALEYIAFQLGIMIHPSSWRKTEN